MCIEAHPNSTATEIAENISESRQKVVESIKGDPRFHVFKERGELAARYNLSKHGERLSTEVPKKDPMAEAINGLIDPLTNHIRSQIDAELVRIMKAEVNAAILDIEKRVKERLCSSLSMGVKLDAFTLGTLGENKIKHTDIADILPELSSAAERQKFNPPVNTEFFPNDILSKRTSHKTHGLTADKPQAVSPVAQPTARHKPKIVVVGLHTNKQEIIKREFREKFDLRLFNPDQLAFIKKAINPGDQVICMGDCISHKHTDVVVAEGGKMTVVHGGIPSLRDELVARCEALKIAA